MDFDDILPVGEVDSLSITKPELVKALAQWEQDARDGKCADKDPNLSVEQAAARNADMLWNRFNKVI